MSEAELSVDARAILNYLNELGYRGLTAEQLKEFIKDLKKLIKYEKRHGTQNQQDSAQINTDTYQVRKSRQQKCEGRNHIENNQTKVPNNARSSERSCVQAKELINRPSSSCVNPSSPRKTCRSRSKSSSQKSGTKRSCAKPKELINRTSSSSNNQSTSRKTYRSTSKSSIQKSETKIQRECTIERPESRMWIRPKIPANKPKTSDPVQLYQYYKSEWNRFKKNTPGENSHLELRWKIRHQLMGDPCESNEEK